MTGNATVSILQMTTWYLDQDEDGFGDLNKLFPSGREILIATRKKMEVSHQKAQKAKRRVGLSCASLRAAAVDGISCACDPRSLV